ncbi:MAG: TonB-system energizer ExbB [Desulfobacterota bacterium]|nr:TonB-system energizer ExbB [Thermodesulfobacteriota bacterium]MDW8002524.1 TonB-system energizer ExbB [Deltaproteobacteria bacterium]
MDHLKAIVDYGIIGALVLMSVVSVGVGLERRNFYKSLNLRSFKDKKELELALMKRLHVIATIGSNAPYVGLLGTVLGIMITFATIGKEGIADTSKIMTGLALALKATAVGLAVAIPAVVFYNVLLRRAKELLIIWEIENGR